MGNLKTAFGNIQIPPKSASPAAVASPHRTLNGLTPAEASGINLELGENKWLSMLKKSTENNGVSK
jgi:hypothetical protein